MTKKMDHRCPRKLKGFPTTWCPLAVLRLKQLRNVDHEMSEHEEYNSVGCNFAINHQLANYCFFNYIANFLNETAPPSEVEIAHLLNISVESVKRYQKRALEKMRDTKEFKQIRQMYEDDQVVDDMSAKETYSILKIK
jgi:hypothetical protein